MAKWKKPSGVEIETNDLPETIEYCESLGWEMLDEATIEEPAPESETDSGGEAGEELADEDSIE